VELPLATPTILAGLNQTIMLSLSMVVIASMISVKGLGNEVLRAMGRLDAGKAIVGGLGIVILAIVLDRVTQGLGRSGRDRNHRHWWQDGPVGLVMRLVNKSA
jgi:glycine betaine/proline transport system permease protein